MQLSQSLICICLDTHSLACTHIDLHTLSPKISAHSLSSDHCLTYINMSKCRHVFLGRATVRQQRNSTIHLPPSLPINLFADCSRAISAVKPVCITLQRWIFLNSFQCHNVFFNLLKWLMRLREGEADFLPPLFLYLSSDKPLIKPIIIYARRSQGKINTTGAE